MLTPAQVGEVSTSRTGMAFKPEVTTWGTFEGGNLQKIQRVNDTLTHQNQEIQDNSLTDNRMTGDGQLSGANFGGNIQLNIRYSALLWDLYRAAYFNSLSTAIAVDAATIFFTSGDQSMNFPGGTFTTAPLVGQYLWIAGDANPGNNGLKRVQSVTGTKITFYGTGIVTTTASAMIHVRGQILRGPGLIPVPLTIEKMFYNRIFLQWYGCIAQSLQLNISNGQAIAATLDVMAKSTGTADASIGSGYVAAPDAPMHGPVSGIFAQITDGGIYLPGTQPSWQVNSFQSTINNNLSAMTELGVLGPADLMEGDGVATGSVNITFRDRSRYDAVRNYGISHLGVAAITSGVGIQVFSYPRARLTGGDPQTSNPNQPVTLPINWRAETDTTLGCRYQLDLIDLTGL